MPWSFVGAGTVVEVTATSHTLTLPAGTQSGDLLVAVISSRIASTTSITLPSGWTLVTEQKTNNVVAGASTGIASAMMAYIVRGASAPALGFTHPTAPSVAQGQIVAYRGCAQVSPLDVVGGGTTATAITAVSVAGMTTTAANDLIVMGVAGGRNAAWSAFDAVTDPGTQSGATDTTTAPTAGTWLERADTQTTTGADTSLGIADAIKATAGATGNLTVTASLSGGQAVVAGAFKLGGYGTMAAVETGDAAALVGTVGTVTDTFNRADGALGSNWATIAGAAPVIFSNTVRRNGTNLICAAHWVGANDSFADDQFVELVVGTANPDYCSMIVRSQSTANANYYYCIPHEQDGKVYIGKATNGDSAGTGYADIGVSGVVFAANIGDVLRFEATGSSLVFKKNNVTLHSVTDSSLTRGRPGIITYGTTDNGAADTFVAGPLAVTGTLAATETADVGALTGSVAWVATLAATEAADVASATGTVRWQAVLGANEAADSAAFVGTVTAPTVSTDDFNRADGGFGSNWITIFNTAAPQIVGQAARRGTGGGQCAAYWIANSVGADQFAEAQIKTLGTGIWGLVVRAQATTEQYYCTDTNTAGTQVNIWRGDGGGSYTQILANAVLGVTIAVGDIVRLEAVGNVLTFKVNGVSRASVVDSTYATGAVGIRFYGAADTELDNFLGGPFTGTTALGTLAATETGDAASITGTVSWQATLAATEAVDVAALTGAVAWSATLAATETADAAVFTGAVRWQATLGAIETGDGAAFTGTTAWVATLAATETGDTAAFTGAVITSGTLAATEAADIAALTGTVRWSGTLAAVETADTAAATGAVAWAATLAAVESADTGALTGTVRWVATLAAPETADVGAFTGAVSWQASLAASEAADVGAFTGTTRWNATLAASEAADTAAFTGGIYASGPLTVSEAPDVAAFTATATTLGTLAATEAGDTAAFTGGIYGTGTLAVTEAADAFSAIGGIVGAGLIGTLAAVETGDGVVFFATVSGNSGTLAATEALDVAAATGQVRWAVTLAASEAPDTASITGTARTLGTLAATEAGDTAAITGQLVGAGGLAVVEAPDGAAFSATTAWRAVLTVTEAADSAALTANAFTQVVLAATEAPDHAAFNIGIYTDAVLNATEAGDSAAFTSAPVSIQEADGLILSNERLRCRELTSDSMRMRSLKYPIPRPRDLINMQGQRMRELEGVRARSLVRGK
jgi:hypothetical protein